MEPTDETADFPFPLRVVTGDIRTLHGRARLVSELRPPGRRPRTCVEGVVECPTGLLGAGLVDVFVEAEGRELRGVGYCPRDVEPLGGPPAEKPIKGFLFE